MKIRIEFSKHGLMRYIGHLDMMRYFQKAIRRADIDIAYTEGFSPHQMMSFAHPLGVGVESDAEYLDIIVNSSYSSREAIQRLNEVGAEGLSVLSYVKLPEDAKNCMSIVACADYIIGTKVGHEPICTKEEFATKLNDFLSQDAINVVKKTKKSETLTDIKPWIVNATVYEGDLNEEYYNTDAPAVFLKCLTGSQANLKPALFTEAFAAFLNKEHNPLADAVTRKEVYGNVGSEEEPIFKALKDYGAPIQ